MFFSRGLRRISTILSQEINHLINYRLTDKEPLGYQNIFHAKLKIRKWGFDIWNHTKIHLRRWLCGVLGKKLSVYHRWPRSIQFCDFRTLEIRWQLLVNKLFIDGSYNKAVAFFDILLINLTEYFVCYFDLKDNKLNYVKSFCKKYFWIKIKKCILVKKVALKNAVRGPWWRLAWIICRIFLKTRLYFVSRYTAMSNWKLNSTSDKFNVKTERIIHAVLMLQ